MTDKQIIIDGVNVKDCKRRMGKDNYCRYYKRLCSENNFNCIWKKYLRREQEYEELRQYHNKCCEEFELEKQALLEKYNQVSKDFYNGKYCNKENCSLLKAKEQECEELKDKLNCCFCNPYIELNDIEKRLKCVEVTECFRRQLDQLKKTLTEIKEICNSVENIENVNSLYDAKLSGMFLQANKILQKISEVENGFRY